MRSRLEPLIGILTNGVATLDDTLRRNTDAALGEKCRQAGGVLSIESGCKLQVNFSRGLLIGLRHILLSYSRCRQCGQKGRDQKADLSSHSFLLLLPHIGSWRQGCARGITKQCPAAKNRDAGRWACRASQIARGDIILATGEVSYGLPKIHTVTDMTVDLKNLRYFLAVAEERNITRAAEKLGMQQPPLSQRIKEIERQLEVQLFRRKARGVDLTDAGRVLLDSARTMLAQYGRGLQATRRAARGEQGELSVGVMPTAFFHPFVPSAIRDFRKFYPDVAVSLDECLRTEAFERIRNERMDVAFMRTTGHAPEGLIIYPLLTEPMILAVPAAHELARRDRGKSLSLRSAADATFIVYARQLGPVFFEATIAACRRAGFSPRIGQEAPLAVSALNLVSAEVGIAVVPQALRRMSLDGVVYRDLKGEIPKAFLTVAARRNDPSNVVRNFLTMVRRRAKETTARS